uniref:Ig-like domain-containing protein n=1 Tax=Equus asinus asinus TaxID=83772 RepID=A0A8C4PMU1_EQUAS
MLSASCSGLVILLMLRTNGDSVTQTEGPVTLPDRAPLTLNCTYQSSYSVFLLWYVQYQNKEPELLLKSSSENQDVNSRGFQANHVKSDSSFHLQKPSVQVSDSAVYYCTLRDTKTDLQGPGLLVSVPLNFLP